MRDGHWRWTTARVRSCRAARVDPRGPDQDPEVLPGGRDLDRVLVEESGLDRPLHAELAQEVGHEGPPDLTLLFERHSFGHVHCLLRFGAPLRSLLSRGPPSSRSRAFHRRRAGARRLAAIAPAPGRAAGAAARAAVVGPLRSSRPPAASGLAPLGRRPPRSIVGPRRGALPPGRPLALTALAALPPWPDRPPPLRRDRSRRGRAPTGRTRARTLASTRTRPKRPVFGSSTTITSASPTATPELVQGLLGRLFDGLARHLNPLHALSSLSCPLRARPRVRLWRVLLDAVVARRRAVRRRFPAAGFLPLAGARPFVLARAVPWPAATWPWRPPSRPSPSTSSWPASEAAVSPSPSSPPWPEPISRSAATGVTMPVRNITSCVPIRMADDTTM